MPEISVYYRDIGVQMPDLSVCTVKCKLRDYYSDVEILGELGKRLKLRTLGGLILLLQHVDLNQGLESEFFVNVEVVKGGGVVDYKWDEPLG